MNQQLGEQFQNTIVDMEFGRYEIAKQRLEWIIANEPTFPGAQEKLTEVLVQINLQENYVAPTATPSLTPTPDFSGAQEAFARVAGRFGHLRVPEAFDAYLRRTVVNLCNSHFRHQRVVRAALEREAAEADRPVEPPDLGLRDELRLALHQLPMRQRTAIARALANEPALVLADEPTGNLDSATGREILELFHRIHRAGGTLVLITHDPTIAEQAPRRVALRDGRVESDSGRAPRVERIPVPT